MGPIFVGFVLDLLYLHLHAIFCERDVLALHLLARVLADILHDAVDDEADRGEDADEDQEEDEGDEIAGTHGWGFAVYRECIDLRGLSGFFKEKKSKIWRVLWGGWKEEGNGGKTRYMLPRISLSCAQIVAGTAAWSGYGPCKARMFKIRRE